MTIEMEEILQKYGVETPEELDKRLEQYKFLSEHKYTCVDLEGYNRTLESLTTFFRLQNDLGYDIYEFIKAFMVGDAMWAYEPEKRMIGEFKVDEPFSQQITIKRVIDKNKIN